MQQRHPSSQPIPYLVVDGGQRRGCRGTESELWEFLVACLQSGLVAGFLSCSQPKDPQKDVCRETAPRYEGEEEQHHRDQRQRGRSAGVPPTTERGEAPRAGDGEAGESGPYLSGDVPLLLSGL